MTINKMMLVMALVVTGPNCFAAESSRNISNGVSNIAVGSGQLVTGSVKVAATIIAVPMVSVGAVGKGVLDSGKSMIEWGTGETPLPIATETITVGPSPKAALAAQEIRK